MFSEPCIWDTKQNNKVLDPDQPCDRWATEICLERGCAQTEMKLWLGRACRAGWDASAGEGQLNAECLGITTHMLDWTCMNFAQVQFQHSWIADVDDLIANRPRSVCWIMIFLIVIGYD